MPTSGPDRQLGWYYALSQIGFEMVVPIALGWWLDSLLSTEPWLLVIGVVLGPVLGFTHLVLLINHRPPEDDKP